MPIVAASGSAKAPDWLEICDGQDHCGFAQFQAAPGIAKAPDGREDARARTSASLHNSKPHLRAIRMVIAVPAKVHYNGMRRGPRLLRILSNQARSENGANTCAPHRGALQFVRFQVWQMFPRLRVAAA